jgi:AcrR family transcriptional regulator
MTRNAPIATRNEVARAVRSALVTNGYADLRTAHIADASSKSEGSLYYYYETKDEQLAVFLRRAPTWFDERIEEIDASDPDERLREICDLLIASDEDDPLYGLQIVLMQLTSHASYNPPQLREALTEYKRHLHGIISEQLRAGIGQKIYRNDIDPEETATFILMVLDGTIGSGTALEMQGFETDAQTQLEAYLDDLLI